MTEEFKKARDEMADKNNAELVDGLTAWQVGADWAYEWCQNRVTIGGPNSGKGLGSDHSLLEQKLAIAVEALESGLDCTHGFEGRNTFNPCGKCQQCQALSKIRGENE